MAVAPLLAFIAVGPDDTMDLDMVRRSLPAAQFAAKNITGMPWPAMAGRGWRILPVVVRVQAVGADDGEAKPVAARMPGRVAMGPPGAGAAPAPPAPAMPPRPGPPGGKMPLLRVA